MFFTSGGTESNNIVIYGAILNAIRAGIAEPHVIISAIEHPSVVEVVREAKRYFNVRESVLGVDKLGLVNLEQLKEMLTPETCLVSVMLANNEVGTVNQNKAIKEIVDAHNARKDSKIFTIYHSDCSQAAGKIPIHAHECDCASIAGHKLYAPKGIGVLYKRTGVELTKLIDGAGQERGVRPGTENVLYCKALGLASEISMKEVGDRMARHAELVEAIYSELRSLRHVVHGFAADLLRDNRFVQYFREHTEYPQCLPNTLSISFVNVPAQFVIAAVQDRVCVSAGAACHSDRVELSAVLRAMGVSNEDGQGTLRITVGDGLKKEDCVRGARIIADAVRGYTGQKETVPQQPVVSKSTEENHVSDMVSGKNTKKFVPESCPIQEDAAVPAENKRQNMLTFTQSLGCACKLRPQLLDRVLNLIDFGTDPRVPVTSATRDDACVFTTEDGMFVLTIDFFAPVVKDARDFGRVAAANAISDIYAMNGRPLVAIAAAGFNSTRLSEASMKDILSGASEKCQEAKIIIAGGHTIEAPEPFFGLAVIGQVQNPNMLRRNVIPEAKCPAYLVLTKQLGTGMVVAAEKYGLLDKLEYGRAMYENAVRNMAQLNNSVCLLSEADVAAVCALTDVTGFGLAGHLSEMLGDQLSADIYFDEIELIPHVAELYSGYMEVVRPTTNNFEYATARGIRLVAENQYQMDVVCDPSTSGGLLYAVVGLENARRIAETVGGKIVGTAYKLVGKQQITVRGQKFVPQEPPYYFGE